LIEEVKSTETENKSADWWKKSGDSLNYDDFKSTKPKEEEAKPITKQEESKPAPKKPEAAAA
jgi:hypothetical protein